MNVFLVVPRAYEKLEIHSGPSLGVCYLANALRKHNHIVKIFDLNFIKIENVDIVNNICAEKCLLVGISTNMSTFSGAIELAYLIKKRVPFTAIVLGGSEATVNAEYIIRTYPCIDYIIRGEGEDSLCRLAQLLQEGRYEEIPRIEGISFRNKLNGEVTINQSAIIKDIDNYLPSLIDYPRNAYYLPNGLACAHIVSSRGCPYNCSYCSARAFYGKGNWRGHSPKFVYDEICTTTKLLETNKVKFIDDNFLFDTQRIYDLLECLRRGKKEIEFSFACRADSINNHVPLIKQLKQYGAYGVEIGVENASNRLLKKWSIPVKKINEL
jgi:radical SAM superfamily enzyme YgiQ (UPF0313 family)